MEFSEKIKKLKASRGLTQENLSEMLDVPKRTIESWESGTRKPPGYVQKLILAEIERKRPE